MRGRPIAERDRHAIFAVVAMLLAASAVLLAVTGPVRQPPHVAAPRRVAPAASPPAITGSAANPARVAHRFLTGYLAYLYGHAPATAVIGAAPRLVRALRARPPLVPPAMRARHPRVLPRPMTAPAEMLAITALIGDGELADYSIGLLLERAHGRLRVDAVESTS